MYLVFLNDVFFVIVNVVYVIVVVNVVVYVYRAVVDVLIAHPKLTEHSVDMLEAIEQTTNDR